MSRTTETTLHAVRDNSPGTRSRTMSVRFYRIRSGRRLALTESPGAPARPSVRRPARVALMLALAHRLRDDMERGVYASRVDVASRFGVTRSRISQLLELTLLAPDIQEELLFLEAVDGVEPLSERVLRPILRKGSWAEQRTLWAARKGELRSLSHA